MFFTRVSIRTTQSWRSVNGNVVCNNCFNSRKGLATQVPSTSSQVDPDMVETSTFDKTSSFSDLVKTFNPSKNARQRKKQLPPSRYKFRSPKYDRGPLHPHQPLAGSDPASREFVPGPFTSPRLEAAYHNIIAPDFMTMCYQHVPPGWRSLEKGPRLRPWVGDSPYFANRGLRGPRGGDVLRLLRKPINFSTVPMIERVTVHSFCNEASRGVSNPIHVAGMVLQAITNQRAVTHVSKQGVSAWDLLPDKTVSVTVDMKGENMYHFLSKLISVVMPRIKDYNGVRATTGDSSGNLSFGFEPDVVALFPEVEVNYDAYPPKLIPGMHVTIHTTATCDKDARLLLQQFGVPFYGKIVN